MGFSIKKFSAVLIIAILGLTALASITIAGQIQSAVPASFHSNAGPLAGNGTPKPIYNVTFTETGLPAGVFEVWVVNLSGAQKDNYGGGVPAVLSNNITFNETAGTYNFTVSSVQNSLTTYVPTPETGKVSVTNGDLFVIITFSPTPMIPWAFSGAYLNYSISQQSSGGIQYGSAYYGITSVNESLGLYSAIYKRAIGASHYYHETPNGFQNGIEWVQPGPMPLIPYYSLLKEYNNGNSSYSNVVLAQFLNPHSSVTFASTSFRSGVPINTQIGTYLTDEFSATYRYVNGADIPGAAFHAYYDQYSGALLKYNSSLSGNFSQEVQATNIPLSVNSTRLILNVSAPAAEVSINGLPLNLSSGNTTLVIGPGEYFVSASAPGYDPVMKEVTLALGETTYANISLSRSNTTTYTISGYVAPGNSSVVAGQYVANVNSTGFYSLSLPSGAYTISATGSGFYPEAIKVALGKNLTDENFTLKPEPVPASILVSQNVTLEGFNLDVSSVAVDAGNVSVTYTAKANGSLVIEVPYTMFSNYSISDVLASRLYVNGTAYKNFTVAISARGGSYEAVLYVRGLSSDPTLLWAITYSKQPENAPSGLSGKALEIAGAFVVAALVAATSISLYRRRQR